MKDNNTLSFKNRRFIQVEVILILITIFVIIVQAIFFDNKYLLSTPILVWILVRFSTPYPYRYIIEGDKLILKFMLLRNKIINITDIQEIDVSKRNCLSFTYMADGFKSPSYVILFVNEIEAIDIQEELTNRNSNIEVLFN